MEDKIATFRAITEDNAINESQITKFIEWGKGDVQHALNYYYSHLEKGKIKQTQQLQTSMCPLLQHRAPQPSSRHDEQQAEVVCTIPSHNEESSNSLDAFNVLKQGSIQHKKTHDFIRKVRQVYKLPINGKPQLELITNSQSCLPDHAGLIPEEFMMADCLSQAFNPQRLKEMTDNKWKEERRVEESKDLTTSKQKLCGTNSTNVNENESDSIQQIRSTRNFTDLQNFNYKHAYSKQSCGKGEKHKLDNNRGQGKAECKAPTKSTKTYEVDHFEAQSQMPVDREVQRLAPSQAGSQKQRPSKKVDRSSHHLKQSTLSNCNPDSREQLQLGEYFVRAVWTIQKRIDQSWEGTQAYIESYLQELKTKKRSVGKKWERNMNMRIVREGRSIGRIADEEVRIILPLLEDGLIRIDFFFHSLPSTVGLLHSFSLRAKVWARSKLITEPIVENFEPIDEDRQRVEKLSILLTRLNLPVITEALIKARSKSSKNEKKKKEKESIDVLRFSNSNKSDDKMALLIEERNKNELHRMRTDPNYKQKQQNIKNMISQSIDKQPAKQPPISPTGRQQGRVIKTVLQIDTQSTNDKLSQFLQLSSQNCQLFYPKQNFTSQLYTYQAQALAWMLKREGILTDYQEKEELHPLWTEYSLPSHPALRLYFNELTGQVCLCRPTAALKCRGGILADEMGLGKTVMTTGLIVSNPLPMPRPADHGGTLVVVPLTLLSQWQAEIQKHTTNQQIVIYYSTDRKRLMPSLATADIVISTYGTLSHQYAQGCHTKRTGVYKCKWHRVILDQAHYIKGRIIQTSKAVYELVATNRWCLTGTPIQNSVTDIFSELHFVRYTPWSQFACWSRFIAKPLEEGKENQVVYQTLQTILKSVCLRRTKTSLGSDGKPIIDLPARVSKIELLAMSAKERQFYDTVYASSRASFDELIEKGILEAKYMQVFEMLMRLRQICCHPILFKSAARFTRNREEFEVELNKLIKSSSLRRSQSEAEPQDSYYQPIIDPDLHELRIKTAANTITPEYQIAVLQKIESGNLDNCIICLSQPVDPVITCCLHILCKACNLRQVQEYGNCAYCRGPLTKQDFIHLPRENRLNLPKEDLKDATFPSTKMLALKEHIAAMLPEDKAVVFSQFLGMLDLLERDLISSSIGYVRMEGSNTHKQRTKLVDSFQTDPNIRVFLVSLKTAGVGLNLVAANKVFLMEPWWNPAVEEQAIERVHRIGQRRNVEIVRFVMDRTIETRMVELNSEKRKISQVALGEGIEGDATAKIEKLKYLMENY